jgi:hypothetical protein
LVSNGKLHLEVHLVQDGVTFVSEETQTSAECSDLLH